MRGCSDYPTSSDSRPPMNLAGVRRNIRGHGKYHHNAEGRPRRPQTLHNTLTTAQTSSLPALTTCKRGDTGNIALPASSQPAAGVRPICARNDRMPKPPPTAIRRAQIVSETLRGFRKAPAAIPNQRAFAQRDSQRSCNDQANFRQIGCCTDWRKSRPPPNQPHKVPR